MSHPAQPALLHSVLQLLTTQGPSSLAEECNYPAELRGNRDLRAHRISLAGYPCVDTSDDDESPTDTPELWDQTTGTGWKTPETDPGDGRTLVLEYT
jgi:hypothetical protein